MIPEYDRQAVLAIMSRTEDRHEVNPYDVCLARWATSNGNHRAGEICGRDATYQVGDVDLCHHHYCRAFDWLDAYRIETPLRIQRQIAESRREAAERERLAAEARSIVYFLRRADGLVKIGTTTRYPGRLATLRGEHGELQLLLALAGGHKEESALHAKFHPLRVEGEWFRPAKTLLAWIMRQRSPAPIGPTNLPKPVPLREVRALYREAAGTDKRNWTSQPATRAS